MTTDDHTITLIADDDIFQRAENLMIMAGMSVTSSTGRTIQNAIARGLHIYAKLDAEAEIIKAAAK